MEKIIEELIEKYTNIFNQSKPNMLDDPFSQGEDAGSGRVSHEIVEDLKQLKSSLPKPVEVPELQFPQSVVDWLETPAKCDRDELLSYIMWYYWNEDSAYDDTISSEVGKYLVESLSNVVKLLRAVEGEPYTVIKEPLYWIYDPIADQYLGYDRVREKVWWLKKRSSGARAELADAEITKIGEQYRTFAVPVEEEE
jgi:hypothetical protein